MLEELRNIGSLVLRLDSLSLGTRLEHATWCHYVFITLFSILKWSFGDQQDNSLQDYVECSLMLQYNEQEKKTLRIIGIPHSIIGHNLEHWGIA